MPRKKKILPEEIQNIVDQVREKEQKEDAKEARELVQKIREERGKDTDYWDVKREDKIEVFDPTLSYEITGYRPIDETHGLDFNPDWFTETREVYKKTGKYCPYLKDSKRYNEFWKEQYRRCKYGMTVNGYTITGDNYFFLNFYQLPIIDTTKESGSGTYDDFPTFFASHYMFFHYLQMSKILHKHCALMKARSIGFSEINASLSARMYSVVRQSRVMITCYNDTFLKTTFSKFDHAITFLNTCTDGGMFKLRIIDQDLKKKSGKQIKIQGQFEEVGFKSEVIGINGSKPSNIRGDRVDLLIFDEAGCHAAGTKVLMFDGSTKNVEDIQLGDKLMGPDGTERNVIELHSGKDQMYKLIMDNKEEQIVNSKHIIYGKKYDYYRKTFTDFAIHAEDFYNMVQESPRKRDGYKLIKAVLDFPKQEVPIDPYIFGYWLGDGDSSKARFTSMDPEVISRIEKYAHENNSEVSILECDNSKGCYHIHILKREGENTNWFTDKLRQLNVLNNKHIPDCYKFNDRETRLQVLAGLVDSDGTYNQKKQIVEITQYEGHKAIIDGVSFICHSLGLKTTLSTRISKEKNLNNRIVKGGILQYRLRILYGHSQIPTLIPRKQTTDRAGHGKGSIDKLAYSFKIEKVQTDNYYGFSLDKDQLFLLEDFTVCHNSWPGLTTAIVQGQELCEVQGVPRGQMLFGGTGGDTGPSLAGLKKIYYNPKAYKILPFRHNWTQDGTTIESGFFIPYFLQSLNPEFMDNRGVCDTKKYKKFLQEERDNLLAVPEDYLKKCAERCWNAEEAFNLEGVNKFNKILIADQLANIRLKKIGPRPESGYIDYFYKNNKHTQDNIDGFKWIPSINGKVQILEHPVWSDLYKEQMDKLRQEAEERGEKFESPVYKEMHDLYVAGIDGIDIGASQTSKETRDPSDFCITIKRRAFGLNEPQYVAMYKDRPNDIREAYKIAMCLARYYNCRINIEATRVGMITWAREKGCLNYFMKRPRATLTDVKNGTTKQYGTPATKTIIEQHTDLTAAFIEDFCHTIWFEEMLDQFTGYNDENKGKFDIVAAVGMTELADQELSGRQPILVEKEVEQFQDYGYYYDERGIKRFGILPTSKTFETNIQKNEYDDPYRIETSDPRLYERLV